MAFDFGKWVGSLFGQNDEEPKKSSSSQAPRRTAGAGGGGGGGGGVATPPKREPSTGADFLERMGQSYVNRGLAQQGAAEDIGAWLMEPVDSPEEFFQPIGGSSDRIKQENELARPRGSVAEGGVPTDKVEELTWEQYDALTPQARAAVDANTLLVNAIRADKSAGGQAADADQQYLDDVKNMFGEGGGSDIYAPETLAVLQQLGISDPAQGDLDRYLNQSALLTQQDLDALNGLDFAADNSAAPKRVQNQITFSNTALTGVADALARGSSILGPSGLATSELEELDQLFEALASRSNFDSIDDATVGETLGLFMQANPTLDEGRISRYFEDRLNAYDYGTVAGTNPSLGRDVPEAYVSPAEFRSRYYTTGGQ